MKIVYFESKFYSIEPVYDGNKPVAFKVLSKKTGEVVAQFPHLWEAEEFIGRPLAPPPSYR